MPGTDVQQAYKNNDPLFDDYDMEGIPIIHMYMTENDGKITHSIIFENHCVDQFVFWKDREFENMSQAVCFFIYGVGDGYLRSVKGLGHRIYPQVEISNRLINETVNATMVGGSLVLQPNSPMNEDAMRLIRLGPVTIVPAGLSNVSGSFNPQIGGMIATRGMLQQIMNNNTGALRVRNEQMNEAPKTAKQSMIEASNESRFEKNQVSFYYVQQDRLHKEIFRRMVDSKYPEWSSGYKEAKSFVKRCIDRGVPKQYLNPEKCRIMATRVIGFGSPFMRMELTNQNLNMMPFISKRGQANTIKNWYAARMHYSSIEEYISDEELELIPTNEDSIISLENNDMVEGSMVAVGSNQDHIRHFKNHSMPALQLVDSYQNREPVDIARVVPYFQVLVPHLQQTLQFIADNPALKRNAQEFDAMLRNILVGAKLMAEDLVNQNGQQQEQQQRQLQALQQAQGGLPPDLQVKLREIELQHVADMEKVRLNAQRNDIKTKHQMMLKDAMVASTIRRKEME